MLTATQIMRVSNSVLTELTVSWGRVEAELGEVSGGNVFRLYWFGHLVADGTQKSCNIGFRFGDLWRFPRSVLLACRFKASIRNPGSCRGSQRWAARENERCMTSQPSALLTYVWLKWGRSSPAASGWRCLWCLQANIFAILTLDMTHSKCLKPFL